MIPEHQRELFKEFEKEKGRIERLTEKVTKRRKLYLHVAIENIVFAVIVGIMCVIAAFALGVERGKKLLPSAAEIPEISKKKTDADEIELKPITAGPIEIGKEPAEKKKVPARSVKKDKDSLYTIQLISCKTHAQAVKEKNKLVDKKVSAFIIRSGSWYQVCAGNYETAGRAKKARKSFLPEYKSCFIRKGVR